MATRVNRLGIGKLLAPEIAQMIEEGQVEEVRAALMRMMEPEAADVLIALPPPVRAVAIRLLPYERAAELIPFLPEDQQREFVEDLGQEQLAGIFNEMAPDHRTDLLDALPADLVPKLMAILRPDERREATRLLGYPPESVGRLITTDFLTVRPNWTARRVLEHIRRYGEEAETLDFAALFLSHGGEHLDPEPARQMLHQVGPIIGRQLLQ
jgi:magnesium transporter